MNSLLNREVAEFERAAELGSHSLNGAGAVYEPGVEAEAHPGLIGGSYVLGGDPSTFSALHSREERRRRVLAAADLRLREEEKAIEDMCGNADPATSNDNHV